MGRGFMRVNGEAGELYELFCVDRVEGRRVGGWYMIHMCISLVMDSTQRTRSNRHIQVSSTTLRLNTLPALRLIRVPLALVHVLARIPAVRALKLDAQRNSVINIFRPNQRLGRIPLLNPIDQRHEDVALRLVRADLVARLPDRVRAVAAAAVARAADGEVAVEGVELRGG
jgi:hypothetical protein